MLMVLIVMLDLGQVTEKKVDSFGTVVCPNL